MKKLIYLFLVTVFAVTTFTSCSNDDDDDNSPSSEISLTGLWSLHDIRFYESSDDAAGAPYPFLTDADQVTFAQNGTFHLNIDNLFTFEGTYKRLSHSKLHLYAPDVELDDTLVMVENADKSLTLSEINENYVAGEDDDRPFYKVEIQLKKIK